MTQQELIVVLELSIDGRGLLSVVETLAAIADAKEAHVQECWQDTALAQRWAQVARILRQAHVKLVSAGAADL